MPPIVLEIIVDDSKGTPQIRVFDKAVTDTTKTVQQSGQATTQATQSTQAYGSSLGASAKSALTFAGALTGVQLGISAIGSAVQGAVTQVVSFEAAMANVNTLGARSAEVQQQLRTQLLQLPPALGSATELAQGLYEVLSSGVEPANAVAFLGEAAALAKAGLAQLDTSVVALTKTMAAYNIPTTQAGEVSDLLFKTVEIGQGSLQQFAGAMPQVVQIAASMGISLKDASNAMATLSQTFKSADTAATGFRSLLSQVIQNNDKFLALGINIKQVISEEGLLGLVRVLQQVSQGDTGKLKEYVNDIEGLNAAVALTGPQFQMLIKNQKEFENAAGSVDRAVKIQTASVKESFLGLVNALGQLANDLAPPFLTAFARIAQGATTVVTDTRQAFKDFPKIVQEALDNIQKEADKFRAATKDKPLIAFTEEDLGMATLKEFFRALAQGADSLSMTQGAFRKARDEAVAAAEGTGQWRDETERSTAALAVQTAGMAENTAARRGMATAMANYIAEMESEEKAYAALRKPIDDANAAIQGFNKGLEELRTGGARSASDLDTRFTALAKNLDTMAKTGVLSAEEVRSAYEKMADAVRNQFGKLPPVLQAAYDTFVAGARTSASGIEQAFANFGIKTRAELQKLATDALADFQAIEKAGTATPEQLLDAWLEVVDKIDKGAFKTLPDGLQASSTRMQDIARKLGVELPKLITNNFGDIEVATKKATDQFGVSFDKVFAAVTAASIEFGNNLRDHLSPAIVQAAEDMGLLGERTKEVEKNTKGLSTTAIQLGHYLTKAGEEVNAYGNAIARLSDETQRLRDLQVSFETTFASDVEGLLAQLAQTQQEILSLGSSVGGSAAMQAQLAALNEQMAQITDRLRGLGVDQFGRPLAGTGTATTTTGTATGTATGTTGGSTGATSGGTTATGTRPTGTTGTTATGTTGTTGTTTTGPPAQSVLVGGTQGGTAQPGFTQVGTTVTTTDLQASRTATYNITVQTQAQDAATLARDLVPYLRQADLSRRRVGG